MPTGRYHIGFTEEAVAHLRSLTARQRAFLMDAIDDQLRHQPAVETRNRKQMRPNVFASWELRVRNLRVYYKVTEDPEPVVSVRGIGVKLRDRVWFGEKEVTFDDSTDDEGDRT